MFLHFIMNGWAIWEVWVGISIWTFALLVIEEKYGKSNLKIRSITLQIFFFFIKCLIVVVVAYYELISYKYALHCRQNLSKRNLVVTSAVRY